MLIYTNTFKNNVHDEYEYFCFLIDKIKTHSFVFQCWYGNRYNVCCRRCSSIWYFDDIYGCTEKNTPAKEEVKEW